VGFPKFLVTPLMIIAITLALGLATRPLVAIIRRLPGVRPVDRYGGAALNGLITLVLAYLAIGAILDFDRDIRPTLERGVVTFQQIEAYRQAVESNPVARQYADDAQIRALERQALDHPIPVRLFQDLEGFLSFYVTWVRDPLLQSRLAPIIIAAGGHLPIIGHPRPWLKPFNS
jgi:hypothetical protein